MVWQPKLAETVVLVPVYHFEKLTQVAQSVSAPGQAGVVICCVVSLVPLWALVYVHSP